MFSVSPEIWNVLSQASRWLFAFFALMLFFFACAWYRSDRREHRSRFRHLPGAGTVGELVVLSGSDELPPDTWFPVPREGILGSLRSDDLVIPCPGVRSRHLTFSWQDGTGLVVRPCLGCDVLVDGVPVDRQSGAAEAAMVHGSTLQVGSALLRLQLYAALSHTNRTFRPAVPGPHPESGPWFPPETQPGGMASPVPPAGAPCPGMPQQPILPPREAFPVPEPVPAPEPVAMPEPAPVTEPFPEQDILPPQETALPPAAKDPVRRPASARRKRADRWKEDWSE